MNKLLYTVLGSILILASCDGRGQKPEHSQNGQPEDKYACSISSAGYCIFTGAPHNTGLQAGTNNIVNSNGSVLFSMTVAVAANSSE